MTNHDYRYCDCEPCYWQQEAIDRSHVWREVNEDTPTDVFGRL